MGETMVCVVVIAIMGKHLLYVIMIIDRSACLIYMLYSYGYVYVNLDEDDAVSDLFMHF